MGRNEAALPAEPDAYHFGWSASDSLLFSVDDSDVGGDGVTIPEVSK